MAEYNNGMWVCQCQYRKECNRDCGMYRKLSGKLSNADRIRSMRDEELSYYLDGLAGDGCPPQMSPVCNKERYKCNVRKCWLEWLKQESEGEQWQS